MSPSQSTRLYFPAWNAALKANWTIDRGTAVLLAKPPGGDWAKKVDVLGGQRAAALFRSPKADDLRHACHLVALGRHKSSKELTNRELDKVLNLFRLLVDECNLAAAVGMTDPQQDERRRLEWAVENCGHPVAYIAAIARATQGTSNWREFDNRKLGLLVATLRNRPVAAAVSMGPRKLPRTHTLGRRTEHQPV